MKNYIKILSAVLFMFCYNTDNCSAEQVNGTTNQGQTIQTIPDTVNSIQQDKNKQETEKNTGAYYDAFVTGLTNSSLIGNSITTGLGQQLTTVQTGNTQSTGNTTSVSDPTTGIGQSPTISQSSLDINSQQVQSNTGQLPTLGNITTGTNQLSTIGTMITGDNTQQQTNALSNTGIQEGNAEQPQNLDQITADTSTFPSLTNGFSAGTTPMLPSFPTDPTEQLTTLAQRLTGDTTTKTNPVPEQMQTVNNMITGTEVMPSIGSMITTPTTEVDNGTQAAPSTQLISNAIQQGQNPTETMPGLAQPLTHVQTSNTQSTDMLNTTGVSDTTTGIKQLPTLGNIITGNDSIQTTEKMPEHITDNTGQLPTLGNITTGTEPLTTLGNMI